MHTVEIETYPDPHRLNHTVAQNIVALAHRAIEARGRFCLVLAGGSTPRQLYTLLATEEYAPHIDWSRVYVFWGDERCVPPDHAESNYRMAHESLLAHVPIPAGHIYRIPGEAPPQQAAEEYEQALRTFFEQQVGDASSSPATFDLVLLGMGSDGHTASLFPGTQAVHEESRWVVACYVDTVQAWRITLTPVMFRHARQVIFLVAGEGKAERLHQVLYGHYTPGELPAQSIRPGEGRVVWMVDKAAAKYLEM
jgi:6-phosphogluconolactonase